MSQHTCQELIATLKQYGITQRELAEGMKVSEVYVSYLASGKKPGLNYIADLQELVTALQSRRQSKAAPPQPYKQPRVVALSYRHPHAPKSLPSQPGPKIQNMAAYHQVRQPQDPPPPARDTKGGQKKPTGILSALRIALSQGH
jgi:transcriptional regulator with XRE-family HTH domain